MAEADIAEFITYYNQGRLHQGIGFVTRQERHEGKDRELREERRRGLQVVCLVRFVQNSSPTSGQRLGKELRTERIETRERSPALQGGANEEVTRGQDYSIILPAVVS